MPGYLLDTCAWIDSLLAPEKLRQPIRRLIGSDTPLHLCSVSLIEFARKEARGEISISMACAEWFERIALPKGKIILLVSLPRSRSMPPGSHRHSSIARETLTKIPWIMSSSPQQGTTTSPSSHRIKCC